MTPTLKQFEDYVVKSGLMTQGELREFLEALPHSQRPRSAEELAKRLVEAGKLTAFQAKCLLQGKTRGLVLGEYVVLEKIGGGGMGVVFKARHRRMDRVVALKTIHPHCMKEPEVVHRFYREVKVAARLIHPNIVLAHDAGEQEGIHYLVMEYVEGEDLGTLVRRRGALPVEEAVDYIVQAARGLAYAHSQGVIHRDIKPGNLLLDRQGRVKILDMGLARLVFGEAQTRTAEQLTGSGQVMGTCDYMAPEQAVSSHQVDHRADIYSLGCTLYRLLTGEPPYKGSTLVEVLLAHREAPIPSLREVRPEVPEELELIFRRMVAKDPEDRYQSMEEVIAALEICMAKVRVGAREETAPWLKPEPACPADQAERETVGVGRREQTLLEPPPPPPAGKKPSASPWGKLLANPYLQLSALGIGLVLLVGVVVVILSRPTPPPRTVKQEPTRGAKPTSPRRPPPLPELKPEWEAAWQEAAKKAEEFLSQQEYGKALAEYQAVADRFRSFELATRLQEVRGQIEEKARTAYVAAEQEARGLLGEKRFAEARAALQPVLERFGIPEYVEPAQRLLGQIEAAERKFAATTAAQAAENMSATEPSGPAEEVAEEKPATPPERTAEERAARAELEKYLALRAEWEEAFRPVEERVASWDFARALEALNSLPLGETPLAERISSRRVEIERMLRLKGQIIQAIQQAHPKLDKMRLLLRGVNGPIVAADDEGITAELPGGKKELHRWQQLSEKSLGRVLPLGIRPEAGEDWLAAGLIALVAKAPTLAEEYFAQAAKRGIKVEDYAGSLVEVAVARAADELALGDKALRRGQEAQKEGKTAEALRRFDEAENHYQAAEKFLRDLASRYSQTPQYQALHLPAQAISLLTQKGLTECAAERLFAQAVELLTKQELFDLKLLLEKMKVQYPGTTALRDESRKPSFRELEKTVENLGRRFIVRQDGKGDFTSIQAAIDAAPPNSLVEIQDSGIYDEKIVIPDTKPGLTLRGQRGQWPAIISLPPKQPFLLLVHIFAPNVCLERLIIVHKCGVGGDESHYGLTLLGGGRLRHCIVFPYIDYNGELHIESCICKAINCQGGPLYCRDSVWIRFPNYISQTSKFHNVLFLTGNTDVRSPSLFSRCTILGPVACVDGGVFSNSILDSVRSGPKTGVEYCCLTKTPPFIDDVRPGVGCFVANPMFRDPANLDYRLMPGSPCIGKASDGGDIGCRYTPEMLELVNVALELRRRGIIKF